jgi:transcriptional regulator MraZ
MSRSVKIDPKGTLSIPANARSGVGDCTETCMTNEDGKSARVYPLRIWNEVEKRLAGMHPHNSNKQKPLIRAKYFGQAVTMEKEGRVLIPLVLSETAHILGEVAVLG